MSASGEESNMSDNAEAQADKMRAEVEAEDPISFEEAMKALDEKMAEQANDEPEQDEMILWATVTYEEGTSGPILKAEGVLVDDEYGVSILDPESNEVTSVGDRFVISVVVRQVLLEDDEDEDEDDEDQDQVDTSADRFRA